MRILLYNPDNGVTRNFMPHLWMFLLQAITPNRHEVLLLDGNVREMDETEIVKFIHRHQIDLVGIGSMTRMIAKAYRMADAIRSAGVRVVMGGPHVTELPDEALGRNGGVRHADAVALGEADETWLQILEDAESDRLQDIYEPVDTQGKETKPGLQSYPEIRWESLDLDQFNMVPGFLGPLLSRVHPGFGSFRVIPMETGRGCPYGCEFCTVTGFFGDSIRFRSNESVVEEILRLKKRAASDRGQIFLFLVDDNFAINVRRTKSLLRAIIAAEAVLPYIAQISMNLLRDEELVDLLALSGARCLYIGMESIDTENLADMNKSFNKPEEYSRVLQRLAMRNIIAITGFIFGMDYDSPGVAQRTLEHIQHWPPGLPIFSQLTPFPSTPLYRRLLGAGRLTRPQHWLDFAPHRMAHTPLMMSVDDAHAEILSAWSESYSPEANLRAIGLLAHKPVQLRLIHLIARLFFRGIYFPQMTRWAWGNLIFQNRKPIATLTKEVLRTWRPYRVNQRRKSGPVRAEISKG